MAMTPRLVMIRGRRADGGLALILDAVDVAESVRISIPTTGGQLQVPRPRRRPPGNASCDRLS
jgi:hypothetical protein